MKVSLIAALAANRVIGDRGNVPWHLPPDLAHFKRTTMGHWLLMGRKTWDAIGSKPLPGRTNVVVTRDPGLAADGAHVVRSIDEGLRLAAAGGAGELFVAGGEEVYRQTLGRADRLVLTFLDRPFPGDARFPDFDPAEWRTVSEERHPPAGEPPTGFTFAVLERVRPAGASGGPAAS
jgi:dihydrofolate reductase